MTCVFRTKTDMFMPFLRDISHFLAHTHVLPVPVETLTNGDLFLLFNSPGIWDSLRPNYQENKNDLISGGKTKNKNHRSFGNELTGARHRLKENVCKNFGIYLYLSPKNSVNFRLLIILGIHLEPACAGTRRCLYHTINITPPWADFPYAQCLHS